VRPPVVDYCQGTEAGDRGAVNETTSTGRRSKMINRRLPAVNVIERRALERSAVHDDVRERLVEILGADLGIAQHSYTLPSEVAPSACSARRPGNQA